MIKRIMAWWALRRWAAKRDPDWIIREVSRNREIERVAMMLNNILDTKLKQS